MLDRRILVIPPFDKVQTISPRPEWTLSLTSERCTWCSIPWEMVPFSFQPSPLLLVPPEARLLSLIPFLSCMLTLLLTLFPCARLGRLMPVSDDDFSHPQQPIDQPSQPRVHLSQTFGRPPRAFGEAAQPLARSAAPPAGFEEDLDDKAYAKPYHGGEDPFADELDAPALYTPDYGAYGKSRSRWSSFRERYLTDIDWQFGLHNLISRKSRFDGVPRDVQLNDPEGNRIQRFESNSVATGKYGPLTFLPKFLFGEFHDGELS